MKPLSALSGLALLILILLVPFLFGEFVLVSLAKLHLNPGTAGLVMVCMFAGGLINIPIKRYARSDDVAVHPLATYGLERFWPRLEKQRRETIIAVNVGGCVVPAIVVIYELSFIFEGGFDLVMATVLASAINIAACYVIARPMEGIGIVMPGLVAPLLAVGCAVVAAPEMAAPVAFVAGVVGPLVGADLLHLREIKDMMVGVASIGGAGTFDGIVLSGILAAYLA